MSTQFRTSLSVLNQSHMVWIDAGGHDFARYKHHLPCMAQLVHLTYIFLEASPRWSNPGTDATRVGGLQTPPTSFLIGVSFALSLLWLASVAVCYTWAW